MLIVNNTYVAAAEYSAHSKIESSYEYNDNIQLHEENKVSIAGYSVSPSIKFGYQTDTIKVSLDSVLSFAKFDVEQYSSDDQHVVLNLGKKSEYNTFSLETRINRDTSRTSELLDTGRITGKAVRREDIGLAPTWLYYLSRQHALQLSGRWNEVEYQSDSFVDYEYQQLDITWVYTLSARSSVRLQASGSHYENEQRLSVNSETYSLRVGGETALSKNLTLSALAGVMEMTTDYEFREHLDSGVNSEFDDTTFVFDSNLKYQQQRYNLALNIMRKNQPSGNGYEQRSERVSLNYNYHLSERMSLTLNTVYGENESQDDSIQDARSYSRFNIKLGYWVTKSFGIEGHYRSRSQDRENVSGKAESNAVFLTLSYKPQHQKWSR